MNPPPTFWKQVEALFYSVVDLDAPERTRRLEETPDEGLRREVESLLSALDEADTNLTNLDKLAEAAPAAGTPDRTGTRVGQYEIRLPTSSSKVRGSSTDFIAAVQCRNTYSRCLPGDRDDEGYHRLIKAANFASTTRCCQAALLMPKGKCGSRSEGRPAVKRIPDLEART